MKIIRPKKRPAYGYERIPVYRTLRLADYSGFTTEQSPIISNDAIESAKEWVDENGL